MLPLQNIILVNLVTDYFADSVYSVFIGYYNYCDVTNQIVLWAGHCERMLHQSQSSTLYNQFILSVIGQKNPQYDNRKMLNSPSDNRPSYQ